ncbi:MAG TPA: HAMP domain-containing sensor histidine kinase [Ktedonobacteraceae bacterium]|nr:HAMP domain-containing sensor histidine kinase [Ktedonobacteraceae bacterium]
MSVEPSGRTLEKTREKVMNMVPPTPPDEQQARRSLASAWRQRPLSGLRWQLTLMYSALLGILLIALSILAYFSIASGTARKDVQITILVATFALIVAEVVLVFLLTNMLLRPLRHLSDAAQSIALGDLQQRNRLTPLMNNNDEVSKTAASLNEIVGQLEQAERVQQDGDTRFHRLFSDASHQLRTPLTSLRGFTEVLMRSPHEDEETRQRVLRIMKTEAERMTRLVNDLLMLARLDSGDPVTTQVIDLVDIAVESVEQTKILTTDERKISLFFVTDERLNVQANPDKIMQALHILFDNALKYGRPAPDGWIRLRIDKQNDDALLEVIDNGKGIDERDLPYIFDHFYRGEHMPVYNALPPPQGAGLGLSIAQAILHAHRGEITVRSEPDKETVFTLRIPCK